MYYSYKGGPGEGGRPRVEFAVVSELGVVVKYVKTVVAILTHSRNQFGNTSKCNICGVYFTAPKTVQMNIEVKMKTNEFIRQEAQL